jgi:protein-disulfide isomerase
MNVQGYLYVLSTLALAVVMYLGYASFFILKTVCVLCVLTYVADVGIFLSVGGASDVPVRSLPRRAAGDLRALVRSPAALVLTLLFVVGSVSLVAFFPRESGVLATASAAAALPPPMGSAQQSEFERWYSTQPRVPIAEPTDGAAVLILKFNDFQCPACGTTYLNYRPILAKWAAERPGAVKFVAKDYPLDQKCNPKVTAAMHQAACEAAVAVRLSRERNRADAMEEWLYTHQSGLTPEAVKQAARDIGGVTNFDARQEAMLGLIRGDIQQATQLGVRVTPTFFINGVKVEGGLRPEYFDAAIAYELKQADQSTAKPR